MTAETATAIHWHDLADEMIEKRQQLATLDEDGTPDTAWAAAKELIEHDVPVLIAALRQAREQFANEVESAAFAMMEEDYESPETDAIRGAINRIIDATPRDLPRGHLRTEIEDAIRLLREFGYSRLAIGVGQP